MQFQDWLSGKLLKQISLGQLAKGCIFLYKAIFLTATPLAAWLYTANLNYKMRSYGHDKTFDD